MAEKALKEQDKKASEMADLLGGKVDSEALRELKDFIQRESG